MAELEDLLEARVNATPQFISLKDMLTKKNAKMKVLYPVTQIFSYVWRVYLSDFTHQGRPLPTLRATKKFWTDTSNTELFLAEGDAVSQPIPE